jgi:hypothetical protein
MADISTEFYWDNVVFKVCSSSFTLTWPHSYLGTLGNLAPHTEFIENTLFCVPRCEFEQSSEVFADMFLLPSGAMERTEGQDKEGQDKEHPIVLEGYKQENSSFL